MKHSIATISFVSLLVFIGCAPVNTKLMYNPKTGDVKECKRDPLKNWTWEEEAVLRRCAEEYKKLGYTENNETLSPVKMNSDTSKLTFNQKLEELRIALDNGLITEQEYNQKRQKILDEF